MKVKTFIVLILLLFPVFAGTVSNEQLTMNNEQLETEIKDVKTLVFNYLDTYGVRFKDIVFAQFLLETGHGKSDLFVNNFNCFGMRAPTIRPHCSIHKKSDVYAKYTSIETSIIDYKIWQDYYCKYLNENEFIDYIGRIYATDKDYIRKLKLITNKLKLE